MRFGLSPKVLAEIVTVFEAAPAVTRVRIFGSRAVGTFREGSDVDLAVEGKELSFEALLKLQTALDDLELPYKFDVVDFDKITAAEVKQHIARVGVELFARR